MNRTPQWLVERIALGELPPHELEPARARLLAEPDGAQRLAELSAHHTQTLERLPPAAVAHEVRRRAAQRASAPAPRRLAFGFALAVPALAALLLWMSSARPGPDDEGTRIKGLTPRLLVHRQTPAGAETLSDGAAVHPGDVLQLSYLAAGRAFGAVLSFDAKGAVTLHLPEQAGPSPRLEPSGAHVLPRAFALDDAPGYERFFLVTADQAFELGPVLDAMRAAAATGPAARTTPLALPAFLSQSSFTVEKRAR